MKKLFLGSLMALVLAVSASPVLADEPGMEADLAGDSFYAPLSEVDAISDVGSATPGFSQTSEFFIGHVAVGIVLPESNGSRDPSSEDWTEAERAQVRSKVQAAFEWWAARYPKAQLTFSFDDGTQSPVSISYEPIIHPQSEEKLWIAETMAAMGYPANVSRFDQVRYYNNDLRQEYDADWAVTVFVVDSSVDTDGRFAGGSSALFAYAYINGPFAVMTYDNATYGIGNMDAVLAHEIGHLFGAMDQYASAGIPCSLQAGYLGIATANSLVGGCPSNVASIMRGGTTPFGGGALDPYAAGQIGWNDTDGDGIPDPLDTPVALDGSGNEQAGDGGIVYSYSGTATQSAFPAYVRAEVLINPINNVEFRVDRGEWQAATASDGAFDSTQEAFTFTTTVPGEESSVAIRITDTMGNVLLREFVMGSGDSGLYHLSLPVVMG